MGITITKFKTSAAVLTALVVLSILNISHAQENSIWSGVYTDEQATRGKAAYGANCASCHSVDLRGNSNTPSLLGMSFMFIWENQTLGDLYTKMRDEMPSDRPASLSSQTYEDLLAFLLSSNQFPSGDQELVSDLSILSKLNIVPNPAKAQ